MPPEVEMCDECEVDERHGGPLNWAGVAWSLLVIPLGIAQGFVLAIDNLLSGLSNTSLSIDRRRRFANEAAVAIESMTRGEE